MWIFFWNSNSTGSTNEFVFTNLHLFCVNLQVCNKEHLQNISFLPVRVCLKNFPKAV